MDDFGFTINYEGNTYDAADFLSRGENKVLLLTLKHLEISFLESVTRKSMLLLFDDLFAELDEAHIGQMLERFSTYQLIFTTQKLPDFLKKNTDFTCINLSLL